MSGHDRTKGARAVTGALLHRGDGWYVRSADPADNVALCELLRQVPMEGAVDVVQERDPDFFRFAAMHLGISETFVACLDGTGQIVGCGTYAVRDAYFRRDDRRRVAYVFDIRVHPEHRGGRIFPELARTGLEHARAHHGVELAYTAVMDGNRRSSQAASSRSSKRTVQPISRPMTRYHMASILFTGPQEAPHRTVARGTDSDLDELAQFLGRRQLGRTLGYILDRSLLEARLQSWPGFTPASFHLIRDDRGRIVACAAPWETSGFRRLRVVRHRGWMRAYRSVYNLQARLRRGVPLPGAGACFRYACLSHLEVEDDDPGLCADLLRSVYRDLEPQRLHFISVMVPRGSRLQQALRGFFVNRVPMTLYTTSLVGSRWNEIDLASSHPGFEMALA